VQDKKQLSPLLKYPGFIDLPIRMGKNDFFGLTHPVDINKGFFPVQIGKSERVRFLKKTVGG